MQEAFDKSDEIREPGRNNNEITMSRNNECRAEHHDSPSATQALMILWPSRAYAVVRGGSELRHAQARDVQKPGAGFRPGFRRNFSG